MDNTRELSIRRSPNVKLVNQREDSTCGRVLTLSFTNQGIKYKVQMVTRQTLLEPEFKFVFRTERRWP